MPITQPIMMPIKNSSKKYLNIRRQPLLKLDRIPGTNVGSVPKVVEKEEAVYPTLMKGKEIKQKGGYTVAKKIPQRTGIDHGGSGAVAGECTGPAT